MDQAVKDTQMKHKTDDQLVALGWKWVARNHLGEAVLLTSGDDGDHKEKIMEWLGEGHTVTQLFE
jgi:hypothetical protein